MRRVPLALRATAAAVLFATSAALAQAAPEDAVASLQEAYARTVPGGEQADFYRALFATVIDRVQRSYATEVDLQALARAAAKALEPLPAGAADPREAFNKAMNAGLQSLDAYSRYLDPKARAADRESSYGSFTGVGLEVESGEGAVRVVAAIPDTPAARAGLRPGDVIVRIDDQPLQGVPLADAIARMRGAPGTPVVITVRRAGPVSEEFTVALTRDTIRRQLVRWSLEGEVLVLRLSSFSGAASAGLQQAIQEATATRAPRGVVLDLRGNPGGLLREAVLTADLFLAQGEIVSLRGRSAGNQRTWKADDKEVLPGVPMVVLVDKRSASASELVAAALQENGRATVMGQRSFGKGTVQTTYGLGDEARGALKLTSAYYIGPSGRSVQKSGVAPEIELLAASTEPPAEAGPADGGPQARIEQARCPALYKASDLALACAVGFLQLGSVEGFAARMKDARP